MWQVEFLNDTVLAELEAQSADIKARMGRIIDLVENAGLESLPRDYAAPLGDKLWEFRLRGRDAIARAIYVAVAGKRVVILRVFTKKSQKTPPREISLARKRAKEV